MDRFAGLGLLAAIASAGHPGFAEAACNNIPSAERLSLQAPPPAPAGASSGTPIANFGFKGALGRIDRVHLLPAPAGTKASEDAPGVTVVADGICVGPKGQSISVPAEKLDSRGDGVALVYFPEPGGKVAKVRVYGTTKSCADVVSAAKAKPGEEERGVAVEVMGTCSQDGVKSVAVATEADGLRLPLPAVDELKSAIGPAKGKASSAIRIVVAPKDRALALLRVAAGRSCSQLCTEPADKRPAVCVDEIFAASTTKSGPLTFKTDPIPCEVQMPTGIANDFAKECENEDATPPACQSGGVGSIAFWQDRCGGVHVPFDWKGILPASKKRDVRGRTGVGREKADKNPPVWIPGREFVGSTPIGDPQGTAPGTNWRRPRIDVWPDNPDEFGLQGTIDQDDSIVHIFPRLPTKVVCAGTTDHACMGIDPASDPHFVSCACADNGMTPCSCDELDDPRFFVCRDGSKSGMPCTRDKHCPGSRCNGTPHCHPRGSVWTGPDDSGTPCETDANCTANQQCGYRLFNFEGVIEDVIEFPPAPKWGTAFLDAKVTAGGARKRRGVCKKDETKACGNGMGPQQCAQDDCRGYQMRAGQ